MEPGRRVRLPCPRAVVKSHRNWQESSLRETNVELVKAGSCKDNFAPSGKDMHMCSPYFCSLVSSFDFA